MAVIAKAPDKRITPKSGQVLDARFYTEEILEFRGTGSGNDFGNDANDRTEWIDLNGADVFHCEITPGAFRGNLQFHYSNAPNDPGAHTNGAEDGSSHAINSTDIRMQQRSRTSNNWGKWVTLVVTSSSTNPTAANPLIIRFYIRRLESRRD